MTSSVANRYREAQAQNDAAAEKALRHPNWVADWPQSGERVVGHENYRRIHDSYPGFPDQATTATAGQSEQWAISPLNTVVRTRGAGDLWIIQADFMYPDGPYRAVQLVELKDELVAKETSYWAAPFDPPAWRQDLVVSIPEVESFREVEPDTPPDIQAQRQEVIERFVQPSPPGASAAERKRTWLAAMRDVYHEDAVQDMPQSGERIESLAKMMEAVERHPDFPRASELRRVVGAGDLFAVELKEDYEEGTYWMVALLEFRGDRVSRTVEYYAKAFDPPEWRAQWVERS